MMGVVPDGLTGPDFPGQFPALLMAPSATNHLRPITIARVSSNFEREPLLRPFGFKGGYMSEIWQTAVLLESDSGRRGIGLGSQGVLWSDATVFAAHAEGGGNELMYAVTEFAVAQLRGRSFTDPIELLESLRPEVYAYARTVTNHAARLLYAAEHGITDFDTLIPPAYRTALAHRHERIASIPLMAYGVPVPEIQAAVDAGYFFLKVKLGQPGTQAEMLERDKARISAIHAAIGGARTPYSSTGRLPYYFDANGRYESKETLLRLLDHARAIGAFDQIALIEEPFPEELEIDIRDLPVRIAADESAHTDRDARHRMDLGYQAIALKPIAKTLSMSLKIARLAHERGVPCFCADLTVNPILVEWNKAVAARLAPFPGLGLGLVETNGHQNYRDWERMRGDLPLPDAPWTRTNRGVFQLDRDYYARSGGLFLPSAHYEAMFPAHPA
jgi:L-alanine-DL-glutamate epimerase-like enolase superfamily enzyme